VTTFGTTPSGIAVGDLATASDAFANVYVYLVTAIDGDDITLKYISGGMSAASPCSLGSFGGGASVTFKRYYSTITLWEAGLDATALYSSSDDAVGECYNDSVFNEEDVVINNGGTVGLSSVTLSVASGERHDGTVGSGARVVANASYDALVKFDVSNQLKLEWLELNGAGYGNQGAACFGQSTSVHSSDRTKQVCANLLVTAGGNSERFIHGIHARARPLTVLNCIVYDIESENRSGSIHAVGIGGDDKMDILNCTVHNVAYDSDGSSGEAYGIGAYVNNANAKVQNCIVTSTTGSAGEFFDYEGSLSSAGTATYNLSSDSTATGTGSLPSKAAANQFVNTTGGSEDLHLKNNADALRAGVDLGTTPSGVEIDIDGRNRDSSGDTWDMGADQCESCSTSAGTVVPQIMNTYKQMAGY